MNEKRAASNESEEEP